MVKIGHLQLVEEGELMKEGEIAHTSEERGRGSGRANIVIG